MDVTLIVANIVSMFWDAMKTQALTLIRKAEAWEMLTSLRLDQAM